MILVDVTALQSEHRLRGVGAYVRNLVAAIEAPGDDGPAASAVHYLASSFGTRELHDLPRERLHVVPRPHRPAQVYWTYNEVALRAALLRWRPRVFVAPDFNGLVANPFGITVAILHDLTELRLTAATTAPAGAAAAGLGERLGRLRWTAYHRKLRSADAVVAISRNAKRDAVELLGIPDDDIRVVHHGVDHGRYRPGRGEGAFAASPPYVLHVGARNANKNQDRLLHAFAPVAAAHAELRLLFAGPWRAADLAWLDEATRSLRLEGRVRHLGFVAEADLPSLYANATAFAFPSLEEGFGMPVLEAMASGVPVVTSDRSSLPEVAGDAALLVDPRDVAAIAAAMGRLVDDEALRARLVAAGIARAARFTWRRTARSTLAFALEASEAARGRRRRPRS